MEVHGMDCPHNSHSIQTVTDQRLHSPTPASAQLSALVWGSQPCTRCSSGSAHCPLFPSLLCPIELCVDLDITFHGQGLLPAFSWCSVRSSSPKDVPDASMERDVLHVHLLLLQLVSLSHTQITVFLRPRRQISTYFFDF